MDTIEYIRIVTKTSTPSFEPLENEEHPCEGWKEKESKVLVKDTDCVLLIDYLPTVNNLFIHEPTRSGLIKSHLPPRHNNTVSHKF